jgi:hypothetical protein
MGAGAGFDPIYMKAIPNEYWPEAYVKEIMRSPWYMVTTHSGHFKIGWRKSVIVLDWEQTIIPGSANQYFRSEDVTKGDRMIHCHGYQKLAEYLKVLANVQVES